MNMPVGEDEIVLAALLLLVKRMIVSALVIQLRVLVGTNVLMKDAFIYYVQLQEGE